MDALELLKKMITVNTVNPPGNERALAVLLFELLEKNGFERAVYRYPVC